jgi:hypothetical protein
MKNTLENKAKFFAQYWGQNILIYEPDLGYHRIVNDYKIGNADEFVAELKPLSQITDEEFKKLEIFPDSLDEEGYREGAPFSDYYYLRSEEVDFLRSKGYALPYMGISVEQQIEWGWVKLKQQ